jgi:hypothetical protein
VSPYLSEYILLKDVTSLLGCFPTRHENSPKTGLKELDGHGIERPSAGRSSVVRLESPRSNIEVILECTRMLDCVLLLLRTSSRAVYIDC